VRLNGLYIVVDLAVRKLDHPLVNRYAHALVLGSLREDVWYVPGARVVFEHLSFSHFYRPPLPGGLVPFLWPGPKMKGNLFFGRAVGEFRAGQKASGFVQLGRVAHLLTDMCCPVHAQRTIHDTDPYEWYVEGNKQKLLELPVPEVADAGRASELLESMARFTQSYRSDPTNHHTGRLLRKWGIWKGVSAREAGEQARALIPMAAAHTVSLLRLYLREVGEVAPHAAANAPLLHSPGS
jgi:hypothetical protein